jgi:GNAT superfamily N-acetyltransferase
VELRQANAVAHEVLRQPEAPAHQILNPEAAAQIHVVVLPGARCHGIGTALLAAAEKWTNETGITYLSAGIYYRNADAVRFYARYGQPTANKAVRTHSGL